MNYRETLKQQFTQLPKKRQNQISRLINVSVDNIKGMLNNANQVRTDKLDLLAKELNIELTAKTK